MSSHIEKWEEKFREQFPVLSNVVESTEFQGVKLSRMLNDFISQEIHAAEERYKKVILSLAYSASLCDHMGDMWADINKVLKDIGETDLANADHEPDEEDENGDCNSEFTLMLKNRGIKSVWDKEYLPNNKQRE